MNLIKCEKNANVDITNEIKKNETNIGCDTIGRKRAKRCLPSKWYRNCKKCGAHIFYSTRGNLSQALKLGRSLCQSCAVTLHDKTTSYTRKCPKCGKILTYSCWTTFDRQNRKNATCKSCSQHRKNIGPFSRKCPTCGKIIWHTEKRRRDRSDKAKHQCLSCSISKKNRLRHQREREKYGYISVPHFNRRACKYFDDLNRKNDWNLQHALNGGEYHLSHIGYWLDAYDKQRNIVVEYDEPHHFTKNGQLKKKDIDRMNEICEHLKCDFWRYNEKTKTLQKYEYHTQPRSAIGRSVHTDAVGK